MLRLSGLYLQRGRRELFRDIACTIPVGGITTVLGPNGAGKSSLLLALAGLLPPKAGQIELDGRSLAVLSRRQLAEHIAWLGELPPTDFGLTVEQRLGLAAADATASAAVRQAADVMDVGQLLARSLAELSSGERQRVELAALMLRDTQLWLLDEPLAHLDLRHQQRALAMLQRQAAKGRTIVTVLHDLHQAAAVSDRVILVDGSGGFAFGEAPVMLTLERLQGLFGSQLIVCEAASGMSFLAPDYPGGSDETT